MAKSDGFKKGLELIVLVAHVAGAAHQGYEWYKKRQAKSKTEPDSTDPTETPQGVQTPAQDGAEGDKVLMAERMFQGHSLINARLIKVVPSGNAFLLELNPDNTLTEGPLHNPADHWEGRWSMTLSGGLVIQIGEYQTIFAGARNGNGGYVGFEGGTNVTLYFVEQREREDQLFQPTGDSSGGNTVVRPQQIRLGQIAQALRAPQRRS
jgi:hypothetical protein